MLLCIALRLSNSFLISVILRTALVDNASVRPADIAASEEFCNALPNLSPPAFVNFDASVVTSIAVPADAKKRIIGCASKALAT